MADRLKAIRVALHRERHRPVPVQGAWLRGVVTGYFAYHAIPTNGHRLHSRAERWIPHPHILHPWPDERFDARTRGRSPVR